MLGRKKPQRPPVSLAHLLAPLGDLNDHAIEAGYLLEPDSDHRSVVLRLCREVQTLRTAVLVETERKQRAARTASDSDDELGRIDRRRERWEHRGPMTYGEAGQMYRDYLDDVERLMEMVKSMRSDASRP